MGRHADRDRRGFAHSLAIAFLRALLAVAVAAGAYAALASIPRPDRDHGGPAMIET